NEHRLAARVWIANQAARRMGYERQDRQLFFRRLSHNQSSLTRSGRARSQANFAPHPLLPVTNKTDGISEVVRVAEDQFPICDCGEAWAGHDTQSLKRSASIAASMNGDRQGS